MSRGNQRGLGTGFTENVPKRGESGPRLLYRTAIRNGYPSSAPHAAEHGDSIPDPEVRRTVPDPESGPYVYITGPFFRPLQTIPPEAKESGNDKVPASSSRHPYIHMTLLLDSKFADCCTLVDYSQNNFSRVVDDIKWLFGSGELISFRSHAFTGTPTVSCLQRSSIYLGTGGLGSQPNKLQPLFGFRGIEVITCCVNTYGRNLANCGRLLWLWGSRLLPAKLRPV
ncbi:hypothetical protein B0H14DRAFT_2643533 [Mycena olivaceomarginata]|nr:hypothetical protein B0H14DRAFT_2643533 [Mycena olivaceomarginata]